MKAVIAYQKKVNNAKNTVDRRKLNKEMEKKRNKIVPSLSIAKQIHISRHATATQRDIQEGSEMRLEQMGGSVTLGTQQLHGGSTRRGKCQQR